MIDRISIEARHPISTAFLATCRYDWRGGGLTQNKFRRSLKDAESSDSWHQQLHLSRWRIKDQSHIHRPMSLNRFFYFNLHFRIS